MFARFFYRFLLDESGQGITEYGAILAFISVLVILMFSFSKGTLSLSISAAFSAMKSQLDLLSAYSGS